MDPDRQWRNGLRKSKREKERDRPRALSKEIDLELSP